MRIRFLLTLAPLALSPALADEPRRFAPGDTAIDASILAPYRAEYAMYIDDNPWATAEVSLARVLENGENGFRHAYALQFADDTVYDETFFDSRGRSLMKFIHGGAGPDLSWKLYRYHDDRIQGSQVFADGRPAVSLSTSLKSPVLPGTGGILASLPLEVGLRFVIATAEDVGYTLSAHHVRARERLEAVGQTFDCWVVDREDGLTRWIAKRPPYMIRQAAPKAKIRWELSSLTVIPED